MWNSKCSWFFYLLTFYDTSELSFKYKDVLNKYIIMSFVFSNAHTQLKDDSALHLKTASGVLKHNYCPDASTSQHPHSKANHFS